MPLIIYKILHVLGALSVYLGFGLLIARAMLGSNDKAIRKLGSIASGVGLLLLLLGGFGMIARYQGAIGYTDWWILVKIVLWLTLGAMTALISRKPQLSKIWLAATVGIGLLATILGLAHPWL